MKHPLLIVITGIIFLSSCVNVLFLFPQSSEIRDQALRANVNNAPEAVPAYLQDADNVIRYQFSLTLVCLFCSLVLLIHLLIKTRKAGL
jgi:hypothetical protein